jgi:hypothetical protein
MSIVNNLISDLREKRLWPVAAALVVALVAVPMLLSTSTTPTPATPAVIGAAVTAPGSAVPAVSLSTSAQVSRLTGKARDPFAPQVVPAAALVPSGSPSISSTGGTSAGSTGATGSTSATGQAGSTSAAGSTTSTASTGSSGGGSAPSEIVPTTPPKPPVTGLSPTQSYHVAVAITNASGGFDTIDPLERLTLLPNQHQPLLIELGVLQGGHRVLFVVQPGTVVSGPGTCTPGTIDCEILSLAQGQTETVSAPGATAPAAEFVVTEIAADQQASAAAASRIRRTESAVGRDLLNKSTRSALSLFRYEPSVGAVVDLRNLTIGGS